MKVDFFRLREFVDQAKSMPSITDKKHLLEKFPDLTDLFQYVYSPYYNYYVTSANIIKNKGVASSGPNLLGLAGPKTSTQEFVDIFALLDALRYRVITGQAAIRAILRFISKNKQFEDLILCIIDKDLKVRLDAKIINKVYPELIPQFDVALALSYWDYEKDIDFKSPKYFASGKIDGCRCVAVIDEKGVITIYSRSGKEFTTLDRIKEDIRESFPTLTNVVFDGEVCIVDEDGAEHFSWVMKEITRKNHTIANPRYKTFDMLTLKEFETRSSSRIFSKRYSELKKLIKGSTSSLLDVLEQTEVKSAEHLTELFSKAKASNWEGLILRADVEYEGKRTKNLLKVKSFYDKEFEVLSIETGDFRYNKEGVETEEEMLLSVKIRYYSDALKMENIVGVGSGFTIEQRKAFYADPSKIIGKTINVRYFEETIDEATGLPSLRFPTLQYIYEQERTT